MKNIIFHFLFLLTLLSIQITKLPAQITRGAQPGEIYIATDWYIGNGGLHYAILHSTDNGESISLQYENIETPLPGEMKVGKVLGDATPGALYNYGDNELWVSFDYGASWVIREYLGNTNYMSGQNDGIIFRRIGAELSISNNYGSSFEIITNPINCPIREPGYSLGEFYGINGNIGVGLFLDHTLNYGQTYTEIPIDSTVAFWQVSGKYPEISRGTEPGELYLISWWPEAHYKIFHSTDTGYSWTLKYQSDYINLYYWGVQYTAGKEPGSFYVKRSRLNDTFDHSLLYIDYSSDYGETFTTYFHELDSLYTTVPTQQKDKFGITVSPNPFSSFTSISFELPDNYRSSDLNIFNLHGQLIRKIKIPVAVKQLQWDGTDQKGRPVPKGIYLLNICNETYSSNYHKLLFTN